MSHLHLPLSFVQTFVILPITQGHNYFFILIPFFLDCKLQGRPCFPSCLPCLGPLERAWPCWHLEFGLLTFQTSERVHFCCFKTLSLWHFLEVGPRKLIQDLYSGHCWLQVPKTGSGRERQSVNVCQRWLVCGCRGWVIWWRKRQTQKIKSLLLLN